jgi:hypothetical protein
MNGHIKEQCIGSAQGTRSQSMAWIEWISQAAMRPTILPRRSTEVSSISTTTTFNREFVGLGIRKRLFDDGGLPISGVQTSACHVLSQ